MQQEVDSQKGLLVVEFDEEVEAIDIDGNNNNVVNGDENSCDLVLNNRCWRSTSFRMQHEGDIFSKGRGFSGC